MNDEDYKIIVELKYNTISRYILDWYDYPLEVQWSLSRIWPNHTIEDVYTHLIEYEKKLNGH